MPSATGPIVRNTITSSRRARSIGGQGNRGLDQKRARWARDHAARQAGRPSPSSVDAFVSGYIEAVSPE